MQWNGYPSLRLHNASDTNALGFKPGNLQGTLGYVPATTQPEKMTFSFYARSDQPSGIFVGLQIGNYYAPASTQKSFTVTTEWQRHHITFDLPATADANLWQRGYEMVPRRDTTVWITGLQLEAGGQPTAFQDDYQAALDAIGR